MREKMDRIDSGNLWYRTAHLPKVHGNCVDHQHHRTCIGDRITCFPFLMLNLTTGNIRIAVDELSVSKYISSIFQIFRKFAAPCAWGQCPISDDEDIWYSPGWSWFGTTFMSLLYMKGPELNLLYKP
jgi:hypothetical protein